MRCLACARSFLGFVFAIAGAARERRFRLGARALAAGGLARLQRVALFLDLFQLFFSFACSACKAVRSEPSCWSC